MQWRIYLPDRVICSEIKNTQVTTVILQGHASMLANSGGVVSNGVLNSQSQKLLVNPSFDLGYTCSDEAKIYLYC